MIDLRSFEGYLRTKGCRCQLMADSCGGDEYILVFGKGHTTAIIYATFGNYIMETRTNMYVNPKYEEIEFSLKEEGII